jgi:hypothetical protein
MPAHRFARLSLRLLRAGIAPRHVKRLIAELEAHLDDLITELRSTGRSQAESEAEAAIRLGTEDALAANIIGRPELQSWARQWPWLAFVLLPLLAVPVQFVLAMLAAGGVLSFATQVLGLTPLHAGAVAWAVGGLQIYGLWIAPPLAAAVACFLAARRGTPALWPIVGSALIALVGASTNAGFEWSPAIPRGVLSGGIGLHYPEVGSATSLRAVLTLLIGITTFLRIRRRMNGENQARSP